ncbi:MAG: response regulator receiver and domain protein [Candidatus Solibacter sp.]|jgi:GAF domain-containing protein|nr:response regulator receiver and domain protein [Candidatus Solibacter sp.]
MATALNVSYSPFLEAKTKHSFDPLLELSLRQTNSQGAYLYRLDRERDLLQLIASRGRAVSEMDRFDVELRPEAARWHRENLDAAWIAQAAWSDWRLERFPEFLRNRFEAAASIPLVEGGEVLGLLHVCRVGAIAYQPREAAFLRSLGLPMGSLLAQSAAVEELTQKLADRKVLDRAKGILQASFQWTEEEAYLFLRRTSRQRRTPMRQIAREVVEESAKGAR